MRHPGELSRAARGQAVRAARWAYNELDHSPLAPLLHLPAVDRLRSQFTAMPPSLVLTVMNALAAAEVAAWVSGGWGVDALAGRQTRPHHDLDVVIGNSPGEHDRAAQVLAAEGFRWARTDSSELVMDARHVWYRQEHTIDLLQATLDAPPFTTDGVHGHEPGAGSCFAWGAILGQPVPCLSARVQLSLHTGYPERTVDTRDMELLRACVSRGQPGAAQVLHAGRRQSGPRTPQGDPGPGDLQVTPGPSAR